MFIFTFSLNFLKIIIRSKKTKKYTKNMCIFIKKLKLSKLIIISIIYIIYLNKSKSYSV